MGGRFKGGVAPDEASMGCCSERSGRSAARRRPYTWPWCEERVRAYLDALLASQRFDFRECVQGRHCEEIGRPRFVDAEETVEVSKKNLLRENINMEEHQRRFPVLA